MNLHYLDRGPKKNHNAWLILTMKKRGLSIALRFGRPEFKLFTERNQGTDGIPKRYYYLWSDRLTLRIWRAPSD